MLFVNISFYIVISIKLLQCECAALQAVESMAVTYFAAFFYVEV